MPKRTPETALTGKGKAGAPSTSSPSRLAMLIASAISQDDDVMEEILGLLPAKRHKDDGSRCSPVGTSSTQSTCRHSSRNVTDDLVTVRDHLISSSLSSSTRKTYDRFWARFSDFCDSKHTLALPASGDTVSQFIAYLHLNKFAPSSIISHLSAISYFHLLADLSNPCDTFVIRKMVLGCRKLRQTRDHRLPLLADNIKSLLSSVNNLYGFSLYLSKLYSAIILLAFHGFFRMGELLPKTSAHPHKTLQFSHVYIHKNAIHLHLHNYKTKKSDRPLKILIQAINTCLCPVVALRSYAKLRGSSSGPFFISATGDPITLSSFRHVFSELLSASGLSPTRYKLHSFRIGACTQAVLEGVPDSQIMQMGRWRSYAFKRYIRLPKLNIPLST